MTTNRKTDTGRKTTFETLESRQLMTNTHVVLDFTPDTHVGNFYDTFRYTKDSRGRSPGFLDFNRDGYVNSTDTKIAAGQVAARVESLFANAMYGYRAKVGYGDVMVNNNMGTNYVKWGLQQSNHQVQVIFVGGRSGTGKLGIAPLANNGTNVEGYGCAYSQETALHLWKMQNAGWRVTSTDFVHSLASTIAHELGHMYGLRHSLNQYSNDIMNPSQSNTPGINRFIGNNRQTSDGTWQSPFNELRRSFNGSQRTYYQGYGRGTYEMAGDASLGQTVGPMGEEGHGTHDGCCCAGCSTAATGHLTLQTSFANEVYQTANTAPKANAEPQAVAAVLQGLNAEEDFIAADSVNDGLVCTPSHIAGQQQKVTPLLGKHSLHADENNAADELFSSWEMDAAETLLAAVV